MKLWRSLRINAGDRNHKVDQHESYWTGHQYELEVFKSQSSLSSDSGLCTERELQRTRVELLKTPNTSFGLKLASRSEPGLVPIISGFAADSVAQQSDRLAPGDKICSINGVSTARLTNDEVLRLLDNVDNRAELEVEYYMPCYASQNSLYTTTKIAEVVVEKIEGSLGLTIRGGPPERSSPLVLSSSSLRTQPLHVTHVTRSHRIKPGDRLLKVDHIPLTNKTLSEVHQILHNASQVTSLTIEYDVPIMECVKLATGPLLVEIERPQGEDLGLFLNSRVTEDTYGSGSDTYERVGCFNAIFIDSILPASISDRCGALFPGDQILAVDENVIEGGSYTAEQVMCYLDNYEASTTKLLVLPRHIVAQRGRYYRENSVSGTLKKQRQRNFRQSSIPKLNSQEEYDPEQQYGTIGGVWGTAVASVRLELPSMQSSGLTLWVDRGVLRIANVVQHSPAHRSGCLQVGDRVLSINGHENLIVDVANELLQRRNDSQSNKFLTIIVEFSMPKTIEASSGVFNVKLAKSVSGLGITITGCKQKLLSDEEPMVISDIKPGSMAHRSGALAVGDQLLAINGQPLHSLSLDTAFNILQNSPDDVITLKIRKRDPEDRPTITCQHNNKVTLQTFGRSHIETKADVHNGDECNNKTDYQKSPQQITKCENTDKIIFMIELQKEENGPLGLTIAGSEDATQPILISGLIEGGVAEKSEQLCVGDEVLSINGEDVRDKPLSAAIKLLQASVRIVQLQICRSNAGTEAESTRDSSNCTSSPGLSSDSAVASWDHRTPDSTNPLHGNIEVDYAVPDKTRVIDTQPYSTTDEDKLMASFNSAAPYNVSDLPLPDYSLNNSLKTFHYENNCIIPEQAFKKQIITREDDVQQIEILTSNMKNCAIHNVEQSACKCDVQISPYGVVTPKSTRNWEEQYVNNGIYTVTMSPKSQCPSNSSDAIFQFPSWPIYENDVSGGNSSTGSGARNTMHCVILYKDAIYDDYGFSVSDGLYERGVYINSIRKGGPADIVGLLRPYDRILQVNGTCTAEYDCCLAVPLIAAATDRLELLVQRSSSNKLKHQRRENSSSPSDTSIVSKTI